MSIWKYINRRHLLDHKRKARRLSSPKSPGAHWLSSQVHSPFQLLYFLPHKLSWKFSLGHASRKHNSPCSIGVPLICRGRDSDWSVVCSSGRSYRTGRQVKRLELQEEPAHCNAWSSLMGNTHLKDSIHLHGRSTILFADCRITTAMCSSVSR